MVEYTKTWWRKNLDFNQKYINFIKKLNNGKDTVQYCVKENENNYYDNANAIYKKHYSQTISDYNELSYKYHNIYIFENISSWQLIEKLEKCIDITDGKLFQTNQYIHSWQVFNGMLLNNETDEDLFIMAFIHDLGKLLQFKNEKPENIYCANKFIKFNDNFDNSTQNWNHDEYCYNRLKAYLPEKLLFCIRYHSQGDMNNTNYIKTVPPELLKFLYRFYEYDQNTKGEYIPEIMNDESKKDYIKNLLLKYFPKNINF